MKKMKKKIIKNDNNRYTIKKNNPTNEKEKKNCRLLA